MTNTKEIIKQGIKPVLHFTCKMCGTEWLEWLHQASFTILEILITVDLYTPQHI